MYKLYSINTYIQYTHIPLKIQTLYIHTYIINTYIYYTYTYKLTCQRHPFCHHHHVPPHRAPPSLVHHSLCYCCQSTPAWQSRSVRQQACYFPWPSIKYHRRVRMMYKYTGRVYKSVNA